MGFQGMHEVLIVAENIKDSRTVLAAVVEVMVNGYIKREGREVQINMRELGKEVLPEQEDLEETMRANSIAAEYSLSNVLANPLSGQDKMELTIRSGRIFCGRVRFYCLDSPIKPVRTDVVLVVVHAGNDVAAFFRNLNIPVDTPVVFAVIPRKEPEKYSSAEEELRKNTNLLEPLFSKRKVVAVWYNALGFMNGESRSQDRAKPYGVEEMFWKLMGAAGRSRFFYLENIIKESERIIKRRASVFQKGSVRRTLELRLARENYSSAVRDIFGAEQLIAVTEGTLLSDE